MLLSKDFIEIVKLIGLRGGPPSILGFLPILQDLKSFNPLDIRKMFFIYILLLEGFDHQIDKNMSSKFYKFLIYVVGYISE